MNKSTKLILLILTLLAIGGIAVYYFSGVTNSNHSDSNTQVESETVTDYDDLLTQVMERKNESDVAFDDNESNLESSISLGKILHIGIRTNAGVVKVADTSTQTLPDYTVKVDDANTKITSVMPIKLVRAFLLDGKQVLIFAVSPGDNNCDVQYQIMSVYDSKYKVTKPFGTCLAYTAVIESNNRLTITMPQNDPYLGDNVSYTYVYQNEQVKLISKPTQKQMKQMYANYTAKTIIDIAKNDGCYQDGVLLDSVACGNNKRYCSMFRNLSVNVKHDSNYIILKDFCS